MGRLMRRGDVYWVELEPVIGSEANKTRAAVIVSNDAANRAAERRGKGVITIVPITSNAGRVLPFQVRLTAGDGGLPHDSKAQAEQVRSIALARLRGRVGAVPAASLGKIEDALRLHLAL
jgi:mRNA interferase MazF